MRWTKFIANPDLPLYNPMKDQNSIDVHENADEKYNRALDLFIESVHKPDSALRGCAHNQHCYDDMMMLRDQLIDYVQKMSNPRPYVDPKAPKSYEYAAHITMADLRRGYKGSSL